MDMIRKPAALLLFLIPLAVASIGQLLFAEFSSPGVDVLTHADIIILSKNVIQHTKETALAAQGYVFAASLLALLVTCAAAIMASVLIVQQESDTPSRLRWRFLAIPALFSSIIFLVFTSHLQVESMITFLGADVFKLTVVEHWEAMEFPRTLSKWIDMANALGISGAVFIAICVCAIAPKVPPKMADDAKHDEAAIVSFKNDVERAADDLEARTRWLKYLLFSASAILISAVANMEAWRGWPTGILKAVNPITAEAYELLAKATIYYHAFMFVLILIAIFLPMAIWMQRNARILSESAKAGGLATMKTPAMWRQENGLSLSFSESFQRILAVLSPILIGPLMELIKGSIAIPGIGG